MPHLKSEFLHEFIQLCATLGQTDAYILYWICFKPKNSNCEEIASQNVVEEQVRELKNLKGKLGTLFGRAVERKFNYPLPH